jgi:hypothetical protein
MIPFLSCTTKQDVPPGGIRIVGEPLPAEVPAGLIRNVFGPPRHMVMGPVS